MSNKQGINFKARTNNGIRGIRNPLLRKQGGVIVIMEDDQKNKLYSRKRYGFGSDWDKQQILFNNDNFICGDWDNKKFIEKPYNQFNWKQVRYISFFIGGNNSLDIDDLYLIKESEHLLSNDTGMRIINPSYYHPAFYSIFALHDKMNDWNSLVASSYNDIRNSTYAMFHDEGGKLYIGDGTLSPDWFSVGEIGNITDLIKLEDKSLADHTSGIESYRIYFNIALDYHLTKNASAMTYLSSNVYQFFKYEFDRRGFILAGYAINKASISDKGLDRESFGMNGVYLNIFDVSKDSKRTRDMLDNIMKYYNKEGYFGADKNEYFEQNWVWFGLWLYSIKGRDLTLLKE